MANLQGKSHTLRRKGRKKKHEEIDERKPGKRERLRAVARSEPTMSFTISRLPTSQLFRRW
jgi:hypothetical protein